MPPAYLYQDEALNAFVPAAAPGAQGVRAEYAVQISICTISLAVCWQLVCSSNSVAVSTTKITFSLPPYRRVIIITAQTSLILFDLTPDACCCCFCFSARHEVITKEILELDTWENQWNVVAINVLMHDSYDVCLVARLNPRDLIPPPPDLVDQ